MNPLEDTLATDDPGDATADRFRYQWAWAAVMCCDVLDATRDVEEVFCEHHEDVLVKHRDGRYTGQQVKTRQDDQPPWKAADKAVVRSCSRFVALDTQFPGQFKRFLFLTNHPLHSANTASSLPYVLSTVKIAGNLDDVPSNVKRWITKIAASSAADENRVFETLQKTDADSSLPKLQDVTMRLINAITCCWPSADDCTHSSVERAAVSLIDECSRASALEYRQTLRSSVSATASDDEDDARRIEGKRMTYSRIDEILDAHKGSTAALLRDLDDSAVPEKGSTDLLRRKLEVGGFSVVSSTSAEDLRDKADYLRTRWISKYGSLRGQQRGEHVSSLVLNDASRAFEAAASDVMRFGPAMREHLRGRFLMRRNANDNLYDTTDEHLEGFAYLLTARCKVAWSHERPWES